MTHRSQFGHLPRLRSVYTQRERERQRVQREHVRECDFWAVLPFKLNTNSKTETRERLSRRLILRDKICLFEIMGLVESGQEKIIILCLYAKTILVGNLCLLCHSVHDLSLFQEKWLLSCHLSCLFFPKLHKQSRISLELNFFLERSGVQSSICRNDARKVLADWLVAKKRHATFWKSRCVGSQGGRSRTKLFAFAFALSLNGSSTNN